MRDARHDLSSLEIPWHFPCLPHSSRAKDVIGPDQMLEERSLEQPLEVCITRFFEERESRSDGQVEQVRSL